MRLSLGNYASEPAKLAFFATIDGSRPRQYSASMKVTFTFDRKMLTKNAEDA
jgi:hypothetical protein